METIYLEENLHTVVKLERLPDADSDIDNFTATEKRTKIAEIFQIAPDHLAFVCVHCSAEFPLFIQFVTHIEQHLQQINSNSIESATKKFPIDSGLHHIDVKPLLTPKYELESDEEQVNSHNAVRDDEKTSKNKLDSHQSSTKIHSTFTNKNRLQLSNTATIEHITVEVDIADRNENESDTEITQPLNARGQSKAKRRSENRKGFEFECFECHRSFKTRQNCRQHVRSHLATAKKCYYCSRPALVVKPIECLFCNQLFPSCGSFSKHGFINHKFTAENLKLLRRFCRRCSCEFKSKTLDERHAELNRIHKQHSEQNYKCNLCGKVYRQEMNLKAHMVRHDGGGRFKCEVCGKTYGLDYKAPHMRTHTGEKKHQCTVCGTLWFSASRLYRHMMVHTGEKPYECDYCHRLFRKRSLLNAHRRMHTGEYVHYCSPCKKGYTCINGLRKHKLKVHGIVIESRKKHNILIN